MADNPDRDAAESAEAGCELIPETLTELHEVLEWEAAVRARAAEAAE